MLGDLLLLAGFVSLMVGAFTYVTDPARATMSLPRPVALADEEPTPTPTAEPAVTPAQTPVPAANLTPTAVPTATPAPAPTATPIPPGVPVRLAIPSIELDSEVKEIGTAYKNGELIWETIPFFVGHYRTTAKAGDKGNAVYSGHVASRNWGNVFINLYKVEVGDEVVVYTDEAVFTYTVSRVRLVLPSETSVMNPTPDATMTLITCAGDWIAERQDYSHRLIVSAKLKSAKLT